MTQGDYKDARQWALRALGRRMHTAHEIRTVLSRRGCENNVVESVLEKLVQQGYIDDLNFARIWVASRSVHKLHGSLRLRQDLRKKGVLDEIIDSALGDSLPDEEEVAIAIKAAEKKLRTIRSTGRATGLKGKDALYRHLKSRGFTTRVISLAMAEIILMD